MKTFVKFFYGPIVKIETAINNYTSDNNLEIVSINFQSTEPILNVEGKVYNAAVVFKEEKNQNTKVKDETKNE